MQKRIIVLVVLPVSVLIVGAVLAVWIARWTYTNSVERDFVAICITAGLPDRVYSPSFCRCVFGELRQRHSVPYIKMAVEGHDLAVIPLDSLYDSASACP